MNKNLIALALAGACIAPAAMAQTANPVTLYGRVYVTVESVEAQGGATPVPRRIRVQDEASLLGVRGTEDLGGGLSAFFQLETGFKPDQNDTVFATRNSGVGLQGAWGSFVIGRWDTPWKVTTIVADPFGDLTIGGITDALSGSGVSGVVGLYDRREQNNIQYWSPNWGGFAVRVSYMANEAKTTTVNPQSNGASVTYTGGPVYVGYAYHEFKDVAFATVTPAKQHGNALFGTVTFGPIKLGAVYEKMARTGFQNQTAWMGNITYTLGNSQFIYSHSKDKDGSLTTAAIQAACKVDALGYQYNFTRRTFFLAQYVKIDNNDAGTCNFGATPGPLTAAAGQDPQGVSLGIRHIF
jgi:predicted porin